MNYQNLTIKVPVDTVKRAKVVAAHRGTSISALVALKIDELVGEDTQFEVARRHAFKRLERGWHLGGKSPARNPARD